MRRSILAAVTAATALLLAGATPAAANHSWENYHWSRATNPAQLQLVDSLVGDWDGYLGPVRADWDASSVLSLSTTAGADSLVERSACLPIAGKIRVCNAKYADPSWLGLATIWADGDHITQATTQVNDTWFDTDLYNDPAAKRHVLCQEVGHVFGLDHQYTQPTCMDDTNGLFDPAYVSPASHDYAQLDAIYTHLDTKSPRGGKKNNGGNGGGKGHSEGRGALHGSDVRVWKEGKYTVIQFVLLAPTHS